MPIVADEYTHVIGVDTHARTHTYAIVETITGRLVTVAEFPTSSAGLARAITWMSRHAPGRTLVAIEGTGSFGAGWQPCWRTRASLWSKPGRHGRQHELAVGRLTPLTPRQPPVLSSASTPPNWAGPEQARSAPRYGFCSPPDARSTPDAPATATA